MNFSKKTLIAANCLLLFVHSSPADTIVLKSGEKIVGNVLREDAAGYLVEIKKGTIRDEKIIPRADVSYVEKETADEKAFREIEGYVPTPDLLRKEGYETRMEKIEEFLEDYSDSRLQASAKEILEVLNEEYAIIEAGGIKFGDEMVSPDDYEANAYEYDVRIAEKRIKDAVARMDLLEALRMFSQYGENFGESEGSQGMSALILQVLKAFKQNLAENIASFDKRVEKRLAGLASMARDDRVKTERALKEEMGKVEKRFLIEKASGQKWITPDAFHKQSMEEALRQVTSEMSRLEDLKPPAQTPEVPLAETYRLAWQKLADASAEEKKKVLEEAKANRLPKFYLEKLEIRAGLEEN
jgi:hypothetical protein